MEAGSGDRRGDGHATGGGGGRPDYIFGDHSREISASVGNHVIYVYLFVTYIYIYM